MAFTTLIGAGALREILAEPRGTAPGTVVLDCRFDLADPSAGRRAWIDGHIPGARYADLNHDLSAPVTEHSGRHPLPSRGALAQFFAAAGIGDTTQVVAYDAANGSFAARAWWLLHWLGIGRAAVLDGGFAAWVRAGGELETGERTPPGDPPRPVSNAFASRPPAMAVAGVADVESARNDPRRLLVDARAPERFSGAVEPIDPVAGHVPGAANHPFADNIDAAGHFLPPAELRRRWESRLAGRTPADLVAMCGSGVTACHNILAMTVAGLPGAQLYAGSWSEWIRDPDRPVTRGAG